MAALPSQILTFLLIVLIVFGLWYFRYNQLINKVEDGIYHKSFSSLASGWDENAHSCYSSAMLLIQEKVLRDPSAVSRTSSSLRKRANIQFIDESITNQTSSAWDSPFGGNFKSVKSLLQLSTHYVEFGAGTGVNLLAATQLTDFALGIEGQPTSIAHVSHNLLLNREYEWSGHTYLQRAYVHPGTDETVEQREVSGSPGCAKSTEGLSSWQVNAYSLPTILKHYEIPESRDTFISIDVSARDLCELLPSWLPWLQAMGRSKPTLYIQIASFDANDRPCSSKEFQTLSVISGLYKSIECRTRAISSGTRSCDTSTICSKGGEWWADKMNSTNFKTQNYRERNNNIILTDREKKRNMRA